MSFAIALSDEQLELVADLFNHVALDIKTPPAARSGFSPIWPLRKVEHTIAQIGRWRRLSRCHEGT